MKKILLSLSILAMTFAAQSQVVVAGVSPASIQGNYDFGVQADDGWPSYTAGSTTGEFWGMNLDFSIPGTFILDTLMLIEDGTPGVNPQGVDSTYEGCASAINDLTGKIAVVYRNSCDFASKVYYAELAGALAVIIINREDDTNIIMTATDIGDGPNTTLPAVIISDISGAALINEMASGPVVMLIGNKATAFGDDVGASRDEVRISPFGGANTLIDNGFPLAIQVYNYGTNPQSAVAVTATIDGPSGVVYNQTINGPLMNSGDTLSVAEGNTYFFPDFDLGGIGSYPVGDYTLTYAIDIGTTDESDFDNQFVSTFTINDDVISLARIDGSGTPTASSYPTNSTSEYQSCIFFEDPNASNIAVTGFTFIPTIDTTIAPLAGEEIYLNIYEWNDAWIDLADPAYAGGANNDWFSNLNQIGYESYYPLSNNEVNLPAYVALTSPLVLVDNQRYLFCTQSYNPEVGFGFDGGLNYDGNQAWSAMPVSPINTDATWYTGGWNGSSASALTLHVVDASTIGIDEVVSIEGKAFPNPANEQVTISTNATGNASLIVTDVTGKVALDQDITLDNNGNAQVNIDSLESGVYVFNVVLENGLSSQFNVIKE
ncbi:MAG: T9SS type A sorting domain-containing protein [Crocinitomicaceae bacterium]|nr:T9SS type A sorting domain-containing protein [Crocinitomicaceae bacterium]